MSSFLKTRAKCKTTLQVATENSASTYMVRFHAAAAAAKSLQSCSTFCDPMDCSLPGSSVRGIFQARVLEWG